MSALKEAVQSVGGAKAAAKACGVSVRAIYKWIAADALPRTEYTGETDYVVRLAKAADSKGKPFDLDRLKAVASPRKGSEPVEFPGALAIDPRAGDRRAAERRQAERRA